MNSNEPRMRGKAQVDGNLVFEYGLPAAGIVVRIYDIGFVGSSRLLGQKKSDAKGHFSISYISRGKQLAIELRVLGAKNREVTVSGVIYNATLRETLNLVVPASVRPLAPEFQRLAADVGKLTGGIAKLGRAQENATRQDLTLLSQSTGWDARLVALAALAAQQTAATGLGQDVLYALFRAGLPTDSQKLALVPSATVEQALGKAVQSNIVALSEKQIGAATAAFAKFAPKAQLGLKTPVGSSTVSNLLAPIKQLNATQQTAFANLYFSQPASGANLWTEAAKLDLPVGAIDALKLQGKFLFLTFNNAQLSQKLQQELGTAGNLSQLADRDYYKSATWTAALSDLSGNNDQALQTLIPAVYTGTTTAERLASYSADLARKVSLSFPTQTVARMVENQEVTVDPAHSANVAGFLRAAAAQGYELGRTPLNAFLNNLPEAVPTLDADSKESLKTLHRQYQITPGNDSLQVLSRMGLKSAYDVASLSKEKFLGQYAEISTAVDDATLVYAKAQQVSSVTFNVFSNAKQLDNVPPIYGLSSSPQEVQSAKNSIIQQFPAMTALFGSTDFCQCEDCRSVLSPAAYFVDLLQCLANSEPNAAGNTPLDVLIGSGSVAGRRPDLGALPLTCENTNTALPYIDVVNEILEYYVANGSLGAGAAYDTGDATTADLVAEPQNILAAVYNGPLKTALFPLNLPFDLWLETVRGFLNYFKVPLDQVLDALRQDDELELFPAPPANPPVPSLPSYYRFQILAESLGLSPSEYAVLTATTSGGSGPDIQNWFHLYGYPDEATALNGDSTQVLLPLTSAKNLAQQLGLTYQEMADVVTTGFLNPALNVLLLQLKRFNISLDDAFSYTGQLAPGQVPFPALSPDAQAGIAALPAAVRTWLTGTLTAGYSKTVLVLNYPGSGCDFGATTLQYADGSAATAFDFLKFNLFVRLWKKLGWTLDETDRALCLFLAGNLPDWTQAGFASPPANPADVAAFNGQFSKAWETALIYLAHLDDLATRLNPILGRNGLLPLWSDLATTGTNPLYAQLFLTPSVLNGDGAFDDPGANFPGSQTDALSQHQGTLQAVLGLSADDFQAIVEDAFPSASAPSFNRQNISTLYRYSMLAKCLQLSVPDLIAVKAMSSAQPFPSLSAGPISLLSDDVLYNGTLAFVEQVQAMQASGFTVEDLQYLLRQQFDPVGKYQSRPDLMLAQVQSMAADLQQIQAYNAVPADLAALSEDVLDQKLSGLVPTTTLTTLLNLVAGDPVSSSFAQSISDLLDVWADLADYEAVAPAQPSAALVPSSVDPALSVAFNAGTGIQWLGYRGVLTAAKMSALNQANPSPLLAGLLQEVHSQTSDGYKALVSSLAAIWTNVQSYTTSAAAASPLDPSVFSAFPQIQLGYDPSGGTQTLSYQGALTAADLLTLAALPNPPFPALTGLLQAVRDQAMSFFQGQTQAAGFTGPTALGGNDLDAALQNDPGADSAAAKKWAKQILLQTFLPLLSDNLSQKLVVKTMAANLDSDSDLTEALTTEAALVSDSNGQSLMNSFLGVALSGVTATYPVGSGPVQATATAADTADPALSGQPASAQFEGYLQVPSDGSYRFYAELGDSGAQVSFELDSLDPSAVVTGPVIPSYSAQQNNDECSAYVLLKGSTVYHFTASFSNLGANGARLLIRGDSMPKGPLNQIQLYPLTAVDNFTQAYIRLSKTVQLIDGMNLDHRELSYFTANATNFGFLNFSALPTRAADDSAANAATLYGQFLATADYTDLKKGPGGGANGLIDVFESVGTASNALPASSAPATDSPWQLLANLTRRDWNVVLAVAQWLNLTAEQPSGSGIQVATSDFGSAKGIRRMWEALQIVQTVGIPVSALTTAMSVVSSGAAAPDAAAANLKNAVKSQYPLDTWRAVAQSVFDPLRQKKRDALVAYLLQQLPLQNEEQLFEYFLVDPGMEPVVQTSRLRLALSSVQTFVQRCFLNLENGYAIAPEKNVGPDALDAGLWAWMKRYRVWEANREIFLFPENWMEPELRLDKTDLFQALESSLLQGDVTSDLVENAFFDYLTGLEVRARLDIVTMYLNQPSDPSNNALHVIGRTYGKPHKYFYRTYSNQAWTPWIVVTPDLEGDHITVAVWHGRLNLFWLTFVSTSTTNSSQPSAEPDPTSPVVSGMTLAQLNQQMASNAAPIQIKIQLNWSQYYQGKWSPRISSDLDRFVPISVDGNFDPPSQAYVHVSKEMNGDDEISVKISIDLKTSANLPAPNLYYAFRVISKNCEPGFGDIYWEADNWVVFNISGTDATQFVGSGSLETDFETDIASNNIGTQTSEDILQTINRFAVVPCANPVAPSNLPSSDPLYRQAAALVAPFFLKDASDPANNEELTFFAEPSLTETTMVNWGGWAVGYPGNFVVPKKISLQAQVPVLVNPGDPAPDFQYALYTPQHTADWTLLPETSIAYGSAEIGSSGATAAEHLS